MKPLGQPAEEVLPHLPLLIATADQRRTSRFNSVYGNPLRCDKSYCYDVNGAAFARCISSRLESHLSGSTHSEFDNRVWSQKDHSHLGTTQKHPAMHALQTSDPYGETPIPVPRHAVASEIS